MSLPKDLPPKSRKDRSYAIDVNPTPFDGFNGDVVFDETAVRAALVNLILGYVGCKSRIFNQKFGSQTYNFLQEPLDNATAAKMKNSILQAISRWEERVRVNAADLVITPDLVNASYRITVNYQIRALEKTATAVFNLKTRGF